MEEELREINVTKGKTCQETASTSVYLHFCSRQACCFSKIKLFDLRMAITVNKLPK